MNRNLAPALALTASIIGAGACSHEPAPSIKVTNISSFSVGISNNPDRLDAATKVGSINPGSAAVGLCVVLVKGYPESTTVYVQYNSEKGYVFIDTGSTETEYGQPQISPSYDQLVLQLPEC